jgi:hypothetical protein
MKTYLRETATVRAAMKKKHCAHDTIEAYNKRRLMRAEKMVMGQLF